MASRIAEGITERQPPPAIFAWALSQPSALMPLSGAGTSTYRRCRQIDLQFGGVFLVDAEGHRGRLLRWLGPAVREAATVTAPLWRRTPLRTLPLMAPAGLLSIAGGAPGSWVLGDSTTLTRQRMPLIGQVAISLKQRNRRKRVPRKRANQVRSG